MSLERTPIPAADLPEALQKFFGEGASAKRALLLARGMAPGVGPADLLTGLYQASVHEHDKVRAAADKSAREVPPGVLTGALKEPLHPLVLDLFADICRGTRELIQIILLNRATADETYERLAKRISDERLLEIIAGNQERLLRHPKIIEALYLNRHTRMSSANRCVELAVRHDIVLDIAAFKEIAASIQGEKKYEDPGDQMLADMQSDHEFAETLAKVGTDDDDDALSDEEDELDEAARLRRIHLSEVGKMTVAQKVRLAMVGPSHVRWSLIRDTNRTVAMSAIKSPAVKDSEIIRATQSRAISDDVIRYIAYNREWLKLHQVKVNLVNNPKCPLPVAMRMLPFMRRLELQALARSKDIPHALRTSAQNLLRTKKQGR